jgi:hypothetical protein
MALNSARWGARSIPSLAASLFMRLFSFQKKVQKKIRYRLWG